MNFVNGSDNLNTDPAKDSSLRRLRQLKEKSYTVSQKRSENKDAYRPWTPALDAELRRLYESDNPVSALATHFGRTKGAILSRLKKLNYFD